MNNRFFKIIATVSTIILTLLGNTVTAKAMWKNLDEGERNTIRQTHKSGSYQTFKSCQELLGRGSNESSIEHLSTLIQNAHTAYGASNMLHLYQTPSDDEIKQCPTCKNEIMAVYCQKIIPQLQQQLANTLLEVDGLKDDVQRLKAELRAEREPR